MKIILASGSPRRKELIGRLLEKYGYGFEIITSDLDEADLIEKIPAKECSPEKIVETLSYAKAESVYRQLLVQDKDQEQDQNQCQDQYQYQDQNMIVIGADTIVYLNGEIIGKPKDKGDAKNILGKLQGTGNDVYTGMTVILRIDGNESREVTCSRSTVYMKNMTDKEIAEYINTGEPLDKAGAYAIQGIGSRFIERYSGDYNNIVGLNTNELEKILLKYGIIKNEIFYKKEKEKKN